MQVFRAPREIVTGIGSIECLGERAAAMAARPLLVTGRTALRAADTTQRVISLLESAGLITTVFEEVEHDPDVTTIDGGRALCRSRECDLVIGLGGGSALDAAKAIAGLIHEEGTTCEYQQGRPITRPALPVIAISTTSGTGSEATKVAVLSDRARAVKQSIRSDSMWPAVAIVDPELTKTCPPAVTAASGLDALVQAIESYTSRNASPLTDALAFDAARRLLQGLPAAFADGTDLIAREQCASGSLMAGMALANARLGAVHGIAHPLGGRYGIEHGLACGLLMPHVMRLNRDHVGDKYRWLSHIAGGDIIDAFEDLLDRFGLTLSVAVPRTDFPAIVAESMSSGSLKANPKPFTEEDVEAVLEALVGHSGTQEAV